MQLGLPSASWLVSPSYNAIDMALLNVSLAAQWTGAGVTMALTDVSLPSGHSRMLEQIRPCRPPCENYEMPVLYITRCTCSMGIS